MGGGYKNKVTPNRNKTLKAVVISSIITAFLTGSIAVVAVSLTAKEIGFTSTNENWQVNNVEDAVNDLYQLGLESSNIKIHNLGTGRTFDISSIVGEENVGNYSEADFIVNYLPVDSTMNPIGTTGSSVQSVVGALSHTNFTLKYNKDTGVLNITGGKYILNIYSNQTHGYHEFNIKPQVYFINGIEIQ